MRTEATGSKVKQYKGTIVIIATAPSLAKKAGSTSIVGSN